jgi:ABC-type microcin C transport system permease subunit YejB
MSTVLYRHNKSNVVLILINAYQINSVSLFRKEKVLIEFLIGGCVGGGGNKNSLGQILNS